MTKEEILKQEIIKEWEHLWFGEMEGKKEIDEIKVFNKLDSFLSQALDKVEKETIQRCIEVVPKLTRFTDDKVITRKTGLNRKEIWDSGVCLDDWDYGYIGKGIMTQKIKNELHTDSLLTGCCYNEWYIIQDKEGNYWTIGMAYHA